MNILISGDLSSLAVSMARRFSHDKHRVILAGSDPEILSDKIKHVSFHSIDATKPFYQKVLSAYKFDAVIFILTREECLSGKTAVNSGNNLDGLLNTLHLSKNEKIKRFFLISSTEVFGNLPDPSENTAIEPASINGYALATGEQYCHHFRDKYKLETTIIRVSHIYGPDEKNSLLYRLIRSGQKQSEIVMPASDDVRISMLHSLDVADFVLQSMDEAYNSQLQIVNLPSAHPITIGELANLLKGQFPDVRIKFYTAGKIFSGPALGSNAKNIFDWIAKRTLQTELPSIINSFHSESKAKTSAFRAFSNKLKSLNPVLKWIELVAGAAAVQYLNNLTGTLLQYKFVDFRLLFVVLMGVTHGSRFGIFAAILASASALLSWYRMGLDFTLLIYNIENWLPFSMYLIAGAVTGYLHDKNENEIRFQKEQMAVVDEKYHFLYNVYDEIRVVKDQFRDQLMGYRDSFGRIYNIATELDTLEEEDIFFRALSILEDVLDNENIALYALDDNKIYGRLQVCSRPLNNSIARSLKLTDFPDIINSIEKGVIYQNNEVQPDYPAYFVPISVQGDLVAGIAVWDANYDQYSLEYFNLIKVISGLIQSSLVRAALYENANILKRYLPNTNILKPEAFKQVIKVKTQMQDSQIAEFVLVRVLNEIEDWQKTSILIENATRSTDYIGQLDDGFCYILLSQTDATQAVNVLRRLYDSNLPCEIVEEVVADA